MVKTCLCGVEIKMHAPRSIPSKPMITREMMLRAAPRREAITEIQHEGCFLPLNQSVLGSKLSRAGGKTLWLISPWNILFYSDANLGALLLIDLHGVKKDPGLLGKALAKVRYGRLGTLSIYLITRGGSIKEWAESVRDSLSKNFDVTVYLYALDSADAAVSKVIEGCRSDDVVFVYREIPGELLTSISSMCSNIEIL